MKGDGVGNNASDAQQTDGSSGEYVCVCACGWGGGVRGFSWVGVGVGVTMDVGMV